MAKTPADHRSTRYTQSFVGGEGSPAELRLQLTKQRQFLSIEAGEVSDLAGLDVVRPWRRADPSVPLDVGIDQSLQPITQAFTSLFEGNGVRVFVGVATSSKPVSNFHIVIASGNVPAYIRIGTGAYSSMFGGGGWPKYLADGGANCMAWEPKTIETDQGSDSYKDAHGLPFRITGIKTRENPNDTIEIDHDLESLSSAFTISVTRSSNHRGIIVTDGREFRLLQGGKYKSTPLLVVDEAQKGDIWRMVRISNSRMLLVSENNIPRVITLEGEQPTQLLCAHDNCTYALATGVLSHAYAFSTAIHDEAVDQDHLVARVSESAAKDFSAVVIDRVNVQQVTVETESAGISNASNDATVQIEHMGRGMSRYAGPPPIITSVTDDAGPNEAIFIENANPSEPNVPRPNIGKHAVLIGLLDLETNAKSPLFYAGTGSTNVNGGREHIMDEPTNQRRINLKFRRGMFMVPHRSQLIQVYRKLANGSDYFLEKEFPAICIGSASFGEYTEDAGDTLDSFRVVLSMSDDSLRNQPILGLNDKVRGVPPAGRDIAVLSDTGTVLIAGKTNLDRFKDPIWGDGRYKYNWPKVNSDNVVHFSRTDVLDPENFPPTIRNQIQLSKISDKFQRFVQAGEDVLAVMSEGVYRLTSGGSLGVSRRVVGETGIGTPWPDSVISVRQKAMWVGASNVYLYDRTAEGTDREALVTVGDDLYPWIRSAAKDGDNIKCVFDPRRQVVIIRRIRTDGTFQDIELSFRGSSSSFMEDRHGADFVPSPYAGAVDQDHSILYAVGDQGDVREIGRETEVGDSHPYDTFEQQVVLDGTHTIDDTSVAKVAAFGTAMVGDAIRFKSTNGAVDEQVRKLKSLTLVASSEVVSTDAEDPSIVMLDSRNGILAYRDATTNFLHFRKITIADSGVVTIAAGGYIPTAMNAGSLTVTAWRRGFVVSCSLATDDPIAGVVSIRDGVMHFMTPSGYTQLETATTVIFMESISIDANNILQLWHRNVGAGYNIEIVAINIGDDGSIKAPEAANIEVLGSVNSDMEIARLSDTMALVGRLNDGGGAVYVTTHSFNGEATTQEGAGSLLTAHITSPISITRLTDSTFIVVFSANAVAYATHGTVDVDTDSATYGDITWGSTLTWTPPGLTSIAIVKAARMTATRVTAIYRYNITGGFKAVTFNISGTTITASDSVQVTTSATNTAEATMVSLSETHWIAAVSDNADDIEVFTGMIIGPDGLPTKTAQVYGPPDKLAFDAVPGLAEGDTMIIGSVPFRIRFAPVIGSKARNTKLLDGISAWIKPDGRTVTTTKEITAKIRRNLADSDEVLNRTEQTEVTIPIKAPSEVSSQDEDFFADIHVSGKMLELEISNDDADTGLSIVTLAGVVKETGDMQGDRSTTG